MTHPHLVSTEWLAAHLDDATVRIVDIRGHVLPASAPKPHYFNHRADYDAAHLPGAVFVDWVQEITDPDSPHHAQIASPERFAAVMGRLGIGAGTFVVAYDDAGGMFAARLWWALHYYGHKAVAVLDGGWQKWLAEGRPTTAEPPQITSTVFHAVPQPGWRMTADEVAARGERPLIDVRTPEEYTGKASRAARAGHIPGAVNIPRGGLLAADGTLLPPEQLREIFAAGGIEGDHAITYCNGGVSASYGLLALKVAGIGDSAAVYDGSWKEWGDDPNRPLAT